METNKIHYFVITKNGRFREVYILRKDESKNIVLLKTIDGGRIYENIDFYAVFSPQNKMDYVGENIYVSKNLNSLDGYFFKKYKITEPGDIGFLIKSFDNVRKNYGEAILNDKHELIGMTMGNTNPGFFEKFRNKINFIDANRIKRFLLDNRIYYAENKKHVDISEISGYLELLNGKVVCFEERVRAPLVIERRK
jgi:hypothetical protein